MKKAIDLCQPDSSFGKNECESKTNKTCQTLTDKVSTIQCKSNEDFINDACYKKCFSGSKDLGFYCKKGKVKKRYIRPLKNGITHHEDFYGDDQAI